MPILYAMGWVKEEEVIDNFLVKISLLRCSFFLSLVAIPFTCDVWKISPDYI